MKIAYHIEYVLCVVARSASYKLIYKRKTLNKKNQKQM